MRFCIAASAPVSVTCRHTAGSHRTSNGYKLSQIMFTIELLLHSRTLGTVSGRSDTPPPSSSIPVGDEDGEMGPRNICTVLLYGLGEGKRYRGSSPS